MKSALIGAAVVLLAVFYLLARPGPLPQGEAAQGRDVQPEISQAGRGQTRDTSDLPAEERRLAEPPRGVPVAKKPPEIQTAKPTRIQLQALNVAISRASALGIKISVDANRIQAQTWKGIERALGEYQWAFTELEKRRSPIVDAIVDKKLELGDFKSFTRPTEQSDVASKAAFKKRLRLARKRKQHGEIVSIQGNSRALKVVRVAPGEDPRLIGFADEEDKLNRKYVSEALKHLGKYLK